MIQVTARRETARRSYRVEDKEVPADQLWAVLGGFVRYDQPHHAAAGRRPRRAARRHGVRGGQGQGAPAWSKVLLAGLENKAPRQRAAGVSRLIVAGSAGSRRPLAPPCLPRVVVHFG